MGGDPHQLTPAPAPAATVASFRTWRGLRLRIAEGRRGPPWNVPAFYPLARASECNFFLPARSE
jgi:hypothetical protein